MPPAVLLLLPPRSYITWPPSLETLVQRAHCLLEADLCRFSLSPAGIFRISFIGINLMLWLYP